MSSINNAVAQNINTVKMPCLHCIAFVLCRRASRSCGAGAAAAKDRIAIAPRRRPRSGRSEPPVIDRSLISTPGDSDRASPRGPGRGCVCLGAVGGERLELVDAAGAERLDEVGLEEAALRAGVEEGRRVLWRAAGRVGGGGASGEENQ